MGAQEAVAIGYALTLVLLFRCLGDRRRRQSRNCGGGAARAGDRLGPQCGYDPFASHQADECGQLLDYLSKKGVTTPRSGRQASVASGGSPVNDTRPDALDAASPRRVSARQGGPSRGNLAVIVLAILV